MKLFSQISKLTAWMIPSKKNRFLYKDYLYLLDSKKEIENTHKNYEKVLARLRSKKGKLKVVFLIRENQKWTYQSLYEQFEKSDRFEPLVLVSILTLAAKGKDKTRNNLEANYDFFKSRGMNVDYAYKNGEYIDLKIFNPDIVFYDQPWDLPAIHEPKYVSKFALTCYCSYSYEIFDCAEDYTTEFHRFLYKFFVEDESNIKRYGSYNKENAKNCVSAGYPKLDEYFKQKTECEIWKDKTKLKIIYAPHHSLEKNGLKLSTFDKNGKFILELAKKHPETTWVFKPHPRFKYALLRTKIMSEEEINAYYNEWAEIGTIYEEGDYIDLFRTSDLMITDGCSFLAEYLPTEKPLIRPINRHGIKLNSFGEMLTKGFYFTNSNSEIERLFEELLINKRDSRLNKRKEAISYILNQQKRSCEKICDYILKILEVEN